MSKTPIPQAELDRLNALARRKNFDDHVERDRAEVAKEADPDQLESTRVLTQIGPLDV